MYDWNDIVNLQHTEACRERIEDEFAMTEKGKATLALSRTRMGRRQGATIAEDQQAAHGTEEESVAAPPP